MSTTVRTKNVWGNDIEPEYAARTPRQRAGDRGVGIRIEGLAKSFGDVPVLHDLDLEVPAGQFLAIVGKSGCGKSTLLRLLVGLGEGVGKRDARRLAEAALAEVQLGEKAGEWPSRLSGGQRQRAALARALVSQPAFLALDEPLGALDALTRITMQSLIERVWQEQGFTALFVTHDVGEAVALADRVIVLDEGRIALDIAIDQPRPRRRGAPDLAEIEGRLLAGIFK